MNTNITGQQVTITQPLHNYKLAILGRSALAYITGDAVTINQLMEREWSIESLNEATMNFGLSVMIIFQMAYGNRSPVMNPVSA